MPKKILWLDLEAADIKADRDGAIHQISYILDIDGEIVSQKSHKCKPFKNDLINVPSLNVCNVKYEDIIEYPEPTIAFKDIVNTIHLHKKLVIGGFCNYGYDNPAFINWWYKCSRELKKYDLKITDYFHLDPLDVRVLAVNHFLEQRDEIKSFKLMDVARLVGIEVNEDKLHDAKYDIELTRDIYYKINAQAK